jgi:hypothetical protein
MHAGKIGLTFDRKARVLPMASSKMHEGINHRAIAWAYFQLAALAAAGRRFRLAGLYTEDGFVAMEWWARRLPWQAGGAGVSDPNAAHC